MRLISNNFTIDNIKGYANLITKTLHYTTFSKLFIADILNYQMYINHNSPSDEVVASLGYCSILIKYKFILLNKSSGYQFNQEYARKIFENLGQFGRFADNIYFQKYSKKILCDSDQEKEVVDKSAKDNSTIHEENKPQSSTVYTF